MDVEEISFLLQSALCRVRALASQPIAYEQRQLLWEVADSAHNLPLVLTGVQSFREHVVTAEVVRLRGLLRRN